MTGVTIVSGPPGAGKTTICRAICARFERAVHLNTDFFFGSIRSGYILPWLPEAAEQNRIVVTAAARSVVPFALADYEVFVDGFIRSSALDIYLAELTPLNLPIHFVMLLPSIEEILHRGSTRVDDRGIPLDIYRPAHEQFVNDGLEKHRLDSTGLDVAGTIERLLRDREAGRYLLHVRQSG